MSNNFVLPIGPIHPALDEPLHFRFQVEGETIKDVEILSGHAHRGMERIAMKNTIAQNVTLCERTCGLCSNTHSMTYCMVMEKAGDIVIPERAQYIRVVADELKRLASHAFAVAILSHLIGFDTVFLHAFQEREKLMDLIEAYSGNRMDMSINIVGGVKRDISDELAKEIDKTLEEFRPVWDNIGKIYETDASIICRTKGVGVISKETAIEYGIVGPPARGSGIAQDVRKQQPYAAYDRLNFNVITEDGCDVYARTWVRIREFIESINLTQQALREMPKGPINLGLVPKIPAGQAVARSEAPRGELFYYTRTNGTEYPTMLKWRVPSLVNIPSWVPALKGAQVADIPAIIASHDPCISCTER